MSETNSDGTAPTTSSSAGKDTARENATPAPEGTGRKATKAKSSSARSKAWIDLQDDWNRLNGDTPQQPPSLKEVHDLLKVVAWMLETGGKVVPSVADAPSMRARLIELKKHLDTYKKEQSQPVVRRQVIAHAEANVEFAGNRPNTEPLPTPLVSAPSLPVAATSVPSDKFSDKPKPLASKPEVRDGIVKSEVAEAVVKLLAQRVEELIAKSIKEQLPNPLVNYGRLEREIQANQAALLEKILPVLAKVHSLATTTAEATQTDHDSSKAMISRIDSSMESTRAKIEAITVNLEDRIDLKDAQQVLRLRSEIERHVRADLIRTMSKSIIPAVDTLRHVSTGLNREDLTQVVHDLERRCAEAGLITEMHLLF